MKCDFSYICRSSEKLLEKAFSLSGIEQTKLGYERVDGGVVLPFVIKGLFDAMGGVVRGDGSFVKQSAFDRRMHGHYTHPAPVTSTDKVIFIAFIHKCWGHVITDAIKRIWFIHTDEYTRMKAEGYKLAYISYPDIRDSRYEYIHRVMQLCGVDIKDMMYIDTPTRFASVVVPDSSYLQYNDHDSCTPEFINTIEMMKSRADKHGRYPEKIYLTRTALRDRRDLGEDMIENYFKDSGYEIISPETLSVDSQISMISQAKALASTEGSVSHSMMFASAGCQCTVIRKANYLNKYQILIAKIFLNSFTYVDANHSIFARNGREEDGPFFLYPTRHLKNYLGSESVLRNYYLYPEFWKYVAENNPLWVHGRNIFFFLLSPWHTKMEIISNKLHYLKFR